MILIKYSANKFINKMFPEKVWGKKKATENELGICKRYLMMVGHPSTQLSLLCVQRKLMYLMNYIQ